MQAINLTFPRILIILLSLILHATIIRAQLFDKNELYPETKIIKGKYYNGCGNGKYWSLEYIDSIGRVIKTESYYKKQLISKNEIRYDMHNNKIFDIHTFDFNNPEKRDTIKYDYVYSDNRIIYQCCKSSDNNSIVSELVENQGDSIFKYQEKELYYRSDIKTMIESITLYTLRYKNGMLISIEALDKENKLEITNYEYFDNGRLKRKTIKRIPEPEMPGRYIGGPGSDDEFYNYKVDSKDRILKFYVTIKEKKYKIATYKYD